MSRPKCYVESPLGFSPLLKPAYDGLLERLRPVVEPINPFHIAGEEYIPGILEASGEDRQARWNEMALRLYRVMRDEADMGFAVVNDDDIGVGCELGYGFCLNDTGYKHFPVVVYRDSLIRGGETENNLNGMVLPPYMETGGLFVDNPDDIQSAVARVALTLTN